MMAHTKADRFLRCKGPLLTGSDINRSGFPQRTSFANIRSLMRAGPGMTDIFFSYSSADRERVRPIRNALVAQGFEVFWDQQVPAGMDWDTWIRQHLTKSKCVMAFWSATSVASDNVRHEAEVAKRQGKLTSVLLEPLTAEQFPLGLYAQQAANLSGWSGDYSHDEWRKFQREFEAKLTPLWVRRQFDELEAELVGERKRREGVNVAIGQCNRRSPKKWSCSKP